MYFLSSHKSLACCETDEWSQVWFTNKVSQLNSGKKKSQSIFLFLSNWVECIIFLFSICFYLYFCELTNSSGIFPLKFSVPILWPLYILAGSFLVWLFSFNDCTWLFFTLTGLWTLLIDFFSFPFSLHYVPSLPNKPARLFFKCFSPSDPQSTLTSVF